MTTLTPNEKCKFCVKYVNSISIEQRTYLLKIIKMKIDNKKITEHADGTRIILNNLDPKIVCDIYSYISGVLNNPDV